MTLFLDSLREFQRQLTRPPVYQGGREIQGLQILKFLCALLVIEIHVPSALHTLLNPLYRIAVPVFFMISGYFLPDATGRIPSARIKRTFWKILRLTLWANVIYFAYLLLDSFVQYGAIPDRVLRWEFWGEWLLLGGNIGAHLWYLTAYLQVLLLLWVIVKIWRRLPRWLFLLVPAGLLLGLLSGRYSCLIEGMPNSYALARNFVTTGLPCVLTGIMLRRGEGWLSAAAKPMLVAVLAIGVLQYGEAIFLYALYEWIPGDLYVCTFPWAIALFLLFLRFRCDQPWAITLAAWGRTFCLDLYVWHILVRELSAKALHFIGLPWPGFCGSLFVAALTFLFAVMLRRGGSLVRNAKATA